MKRRIYTYLIIVITFITLIAIFSIGENQRGNDVLEVNTTKPTESESEFKQEKFDGTGYIFDDEESNVNLPLKDSRKDTTDKYSYDMDKFYAVNNQENDGPSQWDGGYSDGDMKESSEYEKGLTLGEKFTVVKIATKFNLSEINRIRKAIDGGHLDQESLDVIEMIRSRLNPKEYDDVVKIVSKYEN